MLTDQLKIGDKTFTSRLIIGSGKYPSIKDAVDSIENSKTELLTVSVRRLELENTQEQSLLTHLDWNKIWLLPNTAGSKTAEDAIRMAFMAKEFTNQIGQKQNSFIKLEVIPDSNYLLPDPLGTIKAANYLVKNGFTVLPYINADPILALHLQDIGCATVMPLGSPIGSGQGLQNLSNIKIMKSYVDIPVVVDAGIRKPSEVTQILELGIDAVLLNTALAKAKFPSTMAKAMCEAAHAGRLGYHAGPMEKHKVAQASSPVMGLFTS